MKARVLISLLVLGAAAGAYWYYSSHRAEQGLVLAGSVESRQVRVGSLIGGRVSAVRIEEGATVAKDQILVELDASLIDPQIQAQESKVAQLRAALQRTERGPRIEDTERARIAWQAAVTDRQRFEALWKDGVIGRRDYDAALVAEATTQQTYLEAQRGNRPEDRAADRAAFEGEQNRLAYLEQQKTELVVRSPAAGVVQAFELRPGDLVGPNQTVASILEAGQLWIRVYVPEPKVNRVRIGQQALVTVDSGHQFQGKVVEIRDHAEYTPRNLQTLDQRMEQVFGVKVAIDPTPELKPGMTAFVHLQEVSAALPRSTP
ncbi:MAG: efflux RND transporter periplasmic adaptor subunit [Acidobacteriota bacterium]